MVAGIAWTDLLLISAHTSFQVVSVIPIYFNFTTFSKDLFSLVFFLLGDYLVSELYMQTFRKTLSHFIGGASMKNNRDEIVGLFIREKIWLENSLSPLPPIDLESTDSRVSPKRKNTTFKTRRKFEIKIFYLSLYLDSVLYSVRETWTLKNSWLLPIPIPLPYSWSALG
jgi:hypothetical protein